MSWLGNILDDVGGFFESVGQTIAPKDSFVGQIERGVFNGVVAPYQFVGDVVQRRNILNSAANRSIQAFAGSTAGLNTLAQAGPVRSITTKLSPYTLGATDRLQEAADVGFKANQMRPDESLTRSEQFAYVRDVGEIAAGAYGAANAGPVFSAIKGVGPYAALVATASKLTGLGGNGLGGIASLINGDPSGLIDALQADNQPADPYASYVPARARAPAAAATANVNPAFVIAGVVAVAGLGAYMAFGRRRRA